MRALILAVALAVLAVVAVSCSSPPGCSAATCNTCCDTAGVCVPSTSPLACGSAGNVCKACDTGFVCSGGLCQRSGTGGGSGGGSGTSGGSGGGSATAGGSTGGGSGTAGGGSATAGGGSTGGGSGTAGGGASTVMCGTPPNAPRIPIDFPMGACPFPALCGGNPQGSFLYTSACIPRSEFDDYKNRLETNAFMGIGCGAGTVTIRSVDGGLSGSAFFDGGTVCRTVNGSVTVEATIGGSLCNQATICNALNGNFMGFQVNCFLDAGLCDCRSTRTIAINNAAAFTTNSTSLTVTGSNQTFETCLSGGGTMFATRELDAGTAEREPGTANLTRQ